MKPLSEYSHKRNFKKTTEPPAKVSKAKRKQKELMFVVHEHHSSHLHYDLRLELDGVLKSWAVPKGPPTDPKQKRLAVQVEDHPYSYGSFEGTIPEGEYGAGQVLIWDTGTWTPEGDPHAGLKKGHLSFTLHGKYLKGRWNLVRTNLGDQQKNWLLLKSKT